MLAKIATVAFQGIEARPVEMQIHLSKGLPSFTIVGLPDKAVGESRDRVRAALTSLGLALPAKRLTVNLAPADLQKEGSHFDLPLALGLLTVMEILPGDDVQNFIVLGELGLDGSLLPVSGVLPAAIHAAERNMGLVCPALCGGEAAMVGIDMPVLAARSLLELINHLRDGAALPSVQPPVAEHRRYGPDFSDVKGQATVKRALEIAAAGGHNVLMTGPPGAGKSMMAERTAGILPDLSPEAALEVFMIHSVAGVLQDGQLSRRPVFRNPHHSASLASLIGGGAKARPGEVSLAHHGVLFLDELPEFSRHTLDALRQPLETGQAVIARANAHVTYPAEFQLIAAMNPCRCGHLLDSEQACRKAPLCGEDYQSRISGPMMDRIDIHIETPPLSAEDLTPAARGTSESSETIGTRVKKARQIQRQRAEEFRSKDTETAGRPPGPRADCNARIAPDLLETITQTGSEAQETLEKAIGSFRMTARGYHRTLRVARTIADLEQAETITNAHLLEALSFRRLPARHSVA